MNEAEKNKLLMTLGLSAKARKLICGTEQICEAMRSGKRIFLVIEASDTSDNTHKRLNDRCDYYGIKHYRIAADTAALGNAVGKHSAVAATAITDNGLAAAVEKKLTT